ncbi:MAG: dethiobiotin synthase [Candidatus Omnitrophica bacterium]|nr:dethiobiotin synthase [Candidatus Omnitrophota bacterium]
MRKSKVFFITATDTGVGKTITTLVLGLWLRRRGCKVGVMKPVQCAGSDARFLKMALGLDDDLRVINPYYAPEPLSPHLAFRRAGMKFEKQRVQDCFKKLCARYETVLVEGAGGLMVPITETYTNADLIADLKAQVIIVSRLGLGTINHTLLTINELKRRRLKILGLVFCQTKPSKKGVPESTNPQEIARLSGVKVLGIVPYLKPLNQSNILKQCRKLKFNI